MEPITMGIISGMAASSGTLEYSGELIMELFAVGIISGMAGTVGGLLGFCIGNKFCTRRDEASRYEQIFNHELSRRPPI